MVTFGLTQSKQNKFTFRLRAFNDKNILLMLYETNDECFLFVR